MALQMQLIDPTGVEPAATAYLRIVETNFNFVGERAAITVYGYRDQASRDAAKEPIFFFVLPVTPDGVPEVTDPSTGAVITPAEPSFSDLLTQLQPQYDALKAAFYTLLKALPQFSGATDV